MNKQIASLDILNIISQTIFDKKGFNILALDVRDVSTLTEFFVIAEGSVDRHVKAIGHSVVDRLRELGQPPLHVEGEREGDWEVIDYGYIIVHLFMPGMREKYAIEELWRQGKVVPTKIVVSKEEASESRPS